MRYPDYKDFKAEKELGIFRTCFYALLAVVALILLYGWMDKRDQPQLSVMTYECAPEIEMSMPIERVRS